MKIYCDLFLEYQTNDNTLKFLELLDSTFKYCPDKLYFGYMGVCIERLKLIPLLNMLKSKNITYFSVPPDYKNNSVIDEIKAFEIAKELTKHKNIEPLIDSIFNKHTPLFYSFKARTLTDNSDGFIPNNIIIDKIDGHLWSDFEYDKYMYDFNLKF